MRIMILRIAIGKIVYHRSVVVGELCGIVITEEMQIDPEPLTCKLVNIKIKMHKQFLDSIVHHIFLKPHLVDDCRPSVLIERQATAVASLSDFYAIGF